MWELKKKALKTFKKYKILTKGEKGKLSFHVKGERRKENERDPIAKEKPRGGLWGEFKKKAKGLSQIKGVKDVQHKKSSCVLKGEKRGPKRYIHEGGD